MLRGVGVDLLSMERIRPLLGAPEDPFFERTYTPAERAAARASADPLRYYAERFAAKEAVFKALGISGEGVRLNQIETLNDKTGAPQVRLYGALEERGRRLGIVSIHISLSHEPPFVAAFAVCEAGEG